MDNNGWPGEPGVPLNPDRDGWHWLKTPKGRFYSCWWNAIRWIETYPLGSSIDEVWRPAECAYAGPCLTPAEVDARVQQARRDALEEAAQVADKHAHGSDKKFAEVVRKASAAGNSRIFDLAAASAAGMDHEARKIAAAIRALKGEGHE
jgi:uncharacterized protein YggE